MGPSAPDAPTLDKRSQNGPLLLIATIVTLWALWFAQSFFVPMFLSALLAFLTAPVIRVMVKNGVNEIVAIIAGALLMLLPVIGVAAALLRQVQTLIADYPSIVASAQAAADRLVNSAWGQKLHLADQFSATQLTEKVTAGASDGLHFFIASLRTLVEAGTHSVLIFIFAILMLASREHIFRCGQKILAQFEGIEAASLLSAISNLIEKFLLTKLIVIGIVSIASVAVLSLLGLRYAFLLGVMTGVLTLLPEVGFVLGLVPILIVGIATGHTLASHALIQCSLIAIHLVEANWITPKLVGRSLNLNILATFIGLFAGGLYWGVWGMLLSIPVLGVMRIVFSAIPTMQPWAELLSERDDSKLKFQLMSPAMRQRMLATLLANVRRRKPS